MNPPTNPFQNPNPSFTFHHPNPNPNFAYLPPLSPNPYLNPNPNTTFSYHPFLPALLPPNPAPNPNPKNFSSPPLLPSDPNDIESTVSTLKHFLDLAETTLKTVSDLFQLPQNRPPDADFCVCPFDSRHRMPPESLFRHFLRCPASPSAVDLSLLDALRYPKSLTAPRENRFVRPLHEFDADLCLSLDDYGDFGGSNFFYKDCPGVVSSLDEDGSKRTFRLPGVLSVECANFVCSNGDGETNKLSDGVLKMRILPSELWALRSEMEVWYDFPSFYSYTVLRVASCLFRMKESDILKWVISNSPRYGIVIDVPMRDHIFVILKLCLKAIWREAFRSLELALSTGVSEGDGFKNLKSLRFECSRLVEVLGWFASQLSVLYGGVNGKSIAIDMLKQCLLSAAMGSLVFPLGQKTRGTDALKEECADLDVVLGSKDLGPVELTVGGGGALRETAEDETLLFGNRNLFASALSSDGEVFVSQVAAAIAALHERALLEERIMDLRFGRPHSKFELINEHANISNRAIEERDKRPEYRPILEHDGLLWQRAHNLDSSKNKTREELLAEERDYKRRRMSYRGKKLKRSTTQVMRDIIEEHMEEIKQAGGIGCFVKGATDMGLFQSGSISVGDMYTDVDQFKVGCSSFETGRNHLHAYEKQVHSDHNDTSASLGNAHVKDQFRVSCGLNDSLYHPRQEHLVFHDAHEDHKRSISKNNEDGKHRSRSPQDHKSHCHKDIGPRSGSSREYMSRNSQGFKRHRHKDGEHHSRSPHEYRNYRQSHERHQHRSEQDDDEITRNKYDHCDSFSSHRSKRHDDRHSSSSSNLVDDSNRSKYDRSYERNGRYGGRIGGNRESGTQSQNMFEDRYDPSYCDRYETKYDDDSSSRRYVRPDK